jgi:hypothetical protein
MCTEYGANIQRDELDAHGQHYASLAAISVTLNLRASNDHIPIVQQKDFLDRDDAVSYDLLSLGLGQSSKKVLSYNFEKRGSNSKR